MNSRTSGVVIALASAVAGSLAPSAASAYMAENYFIASGLGLLVVLTACIALLHITDRGDAVAVRDESDQPAAQKRPARTAQAADVTNGRRVKSPPLAAQAESAPSGQTV